MYGLLWFTNLGVLYLLSSNGCLAQNDELSPTYSAILPVTPSLESNTVIQGVLEYFRRVCLVIVSFVVILLALSVISISIFVYLDRGRVQKLHQKQHLRANQRHEYEEEESHL